MNYSDGVNYIMKLAGIGAVGDAPEPANAGGMTEDKILEAERLLDQKFPREYRAFISGSGMGVMSADSKKAGDILGIAKKLKRDGFTIPKQLLILKSEGDNAYCALVNGSIGSHKDGEVVHWRPSRDSTLNLRSMAPNLSAWKVQK